MTPDPVALMKALVMDLVIAAHPDQQDFIFPGGEALVFYERLAHFILAREARLREALANLVTALERCEPDLRGAFVLLANHGVAFTGPGYGKELTQAKAALGEASHAA